ncbi:MAG: hypothetical protein QXN59_01670 [Candidatus Micrarchaeaceae archaeon]
MAEMNESKLIEKEMTLRRLKVSKEVLETRRSMVRWLALSLGIINPGESRIQALYVLDAMLDFQFRRKQDPTVKELSEYIDLNWGHINEKTLRYHLLKLKNIGLAGNSKGRYFIPIPGSGEKYDEALWVDSYFDSEISPIKDKLKTMLKEFKNR